VGNLGYIFDSHQAQPHICRMIECTVPRNIGAI
jgi:hypothetical protein